LAAGIDDFVHGYGERALVRTNHPRQFAAGFEAFVTEPGSGAQAARAACDRSLDRDG
jgi:hypothetical protein